ncbi:ABC transporter ATP-binding protein [Malaciobacter halophilus]|uniref:ABC transporter ATP-binding protein n=1 Tax=Malaciobacter halophilus TaxID=197482 RepID=A0A2N1J459_9BACT|nr:ATP-binding cassette domain-containing protein [Malaciobacter halophilus]AXH10417.1 nitrate/sulfonate/bicarbonate ABC transporter, ATP-binding protein [Malaciobacter halophilus]PKI81323.1 ABC transporter ATP-binding protein [Malaciobacter halophilus]
MERLEVKNLSFSFGVTQVLDEINFTLNKGHVLSIVGPSGGGKSTLLKLCANILNIEQGEINNSFKYYSFAFQDTRLLPWKNVIDNISLSLLAKNINKKEALLKAENIAIKMGLKQEDFDKFPKDLSGGMKQRVSFARALVINPKLLFLDEPFSALDIGLKKELQEYLINLVENENLSILFITHDLMEAVKLSDEILVLEPNPGRIIKSFKIDEQKSLRDTNFVYKTSAKLLNNKYIIDTFFKG